MLSLSTSVLALPMLQNSSPSASRKMFGYTHITPDTLTHQDQDDWLCATSITIVGSIQVLCQHVRGVGGSEQYNYIADTSSFNSIVDVLNICWQVLQ